MNILSVIQVKFLMLIKMVILTPQLCLVSNLEYGSKFILST